MLRTTTTTTTTIVTLLMAVAPLGCRMSSTSRTLPNDVSGPGQVTIKDTAGDHLDVLVDGKVTVDYTEPTPPNRRKGREGRVVSSGAFALQAHDPGSTCWFKNIRVKVLPD